MTAPPLPSPHASPLRSSPLANPPIFSSRRIPSPSQARPIPRRTSQPTRSRPVIHPITPTPSGSSATMPIPTPSPPLSRSHPLLGSYPLSLIHSRMSHAHQPHSSSTTFSLHIKAVGQGKRCPADLRCPKPLDLPFSATYYDLEGGSRAAGANQTPWVGTIDLEQHYYDIYAPTSTSTLTTGTKGLDPPDHPGYKVAPVGQLQMIIKTPSHALKAFLVPYDLRDIPVGGRLLARERTYVHSTSTASHPINVGSLSPGSNQGQQKECLRYAFQLQFVCLSTPVDATSTRSPRDSSTTRHTSSTSDTGKSGDRAYYLSKTLKVVFTSSPPEVDETLRTERADEIVQPTSSGIRISAPVKQRRRSSGVFGPTSSPSHTRTSEEWELVRLKWMAKRDMGDIPASVVPAEEPEAASQSHLRISDEPITEKLRSAVLPPFKPPTRVPTPIPQPFNLPNSAQPMKSPASPRFQRRQLRRTSVEERELSEKLRNLGME